MKRSAMAICTVVYLLTVALIFGAVSVLCTVNAVFIQSTEDEELLDLTGVDFSRDVVSVDTAACFIYSGAFYTPEDFAAGMVAQQGIRYGGEASTLGDFGTIRLQLKLPPGEVYAISSLSVSYAQRLFIDGKEYASIGVTGSSIDTVTPKTRRYMEGFQPAFDTTEIILHYSAFVHADGGGLYQMELGLLRNVDRIEQLKTFRTAVITAALVTAMLFIFGLFLFFPHSRYLLWFSLACGCIALRGMLTGDKVLLLLLPELDWYIAIRMEYFTTGCMVLFTVLYLRILFPGAANKWIVWFFIAYSVSNLLFICVAPSTVFTGYASLLLLSYAVFGAYLLIAILIAVLRKKNASALSGEEQILLLFGLGMYTILLILGINAHEKANRIFGLDYPQVGMMVFLFVNILVLVLGFSRIERELDEVRQSELEMEQSNRMLTQLNRIRQDFLANITHELKTPLAVISGLSQYAQAQLHGGTANEDTEENLGEIANEAIRLGGLVDQLLDLSMEKEDKLSFAPVPIEPLFRRASTLANPMLAKRHNNLIIETDEMLPPLLGNADMLLQVLINLITNANKHSEGQEILLKASMIDDGLVEIRVTDHGGGISEEILPFVFVRGQSGDGGTGLGLAICRDVVESHGGDIHLTSNDGSGTSVWFTLPFAKEEAS